MPHISVVAPVYNEQEITLAALADRVGAALAGITSDYEIILVDDGSRLETWTALCSVASKHPQVKGLRFSRNFGQHPAIAAGIDHASGEWVIVMDSDLQDRPEVIPDLYRKAQEGYDVVFVNRQERPETALYQFCAGVFYRTLNFLSGQKYERRQANYSIVNRKVVEAFRGVPDRDRFYGGTVRWLGFNSTAIDALHGEREYGRPSYNLLGRFRFAFRLIFGFSTRLLYVAIVLGLCFAVVAFALATDIVVYKILNPTLPLPGWPSVMTAVFFTAGVTNVMLGLVGIYVGNLVEHTKNRPIYIVAQKANAND
ncbi:glycosyltransferase family 2 protein [Tardiphaga sp.]|uniref:glycosyltransferase family 2 protein n=1 Tax=Tardiphaga sp. TaxID=1926292 RepID=UPI00352B3A4B